MADQVKVTKEVTFDCAHMLSGHDGLCKNLHGHTYKVHVTVMGTPLTSDESRSSDSMVIDFKHLNRAIEDTIISNFDHAIIFSSARYRGDAETELYTWAIKHNMRLYEMPGRTTCESMAVLFKQIIFEQLRWMELTNITDVIVRVYETPTSYAEV